jgi:hypothetical protein
MSITLRDIKEVKDLIINSTTGVNEINRHLSNGWVLIDTSKPDDFTVVFHMGRV